MARFEISTDYLVRFLTDLLETPSPTGDTEYAIGFVEGELASTKPMAYSVSPVGLGVSSRSVR
ncbi:hypothetical protein EON82_20975, partial [bacterium]